MLPNHRVGQILQLLAKDPRTNVLDIDLRIVGHRLFITGTLESAALRAAVEQVVREAVPPDLEIVNNIWVTAYVP